MLNKFLAAKHAEIARLLHQEKTDSMPKTYNGHRPSFSAALRQNKLACIAEYKRASPSRGDIAPHLNPEDVATQYAKAGATALSVLTEEKYFKGSLSFLERMQSQGLPMLRKDFIVHPLQVMETAATPASAQLIIARMFNHPSEIAELIALGESYGIESVVEVFSHSDLVAARLANASIIQVNNRNLQTLETDLATCKRLIPHRRTAEVWIAASGISSASERRHVEAMGYDAMLVGTALMQGGSPQKALHRLLE
ncbi:MAG: indole-3-glycerol-phosphate synthase [Desulfovibrionales bacterium]|nr:indole-3-glycerol-phosphate synthase [Desulfovibrionales bacterium]